jgi:hypothetical protein
MGLVDDKIEYKNPKKKSEGYEVFEGKKDKSLVIHRADVLAMRKKARAEGRREQVKKKVENNAATYSGPKRIHDCGIVLFNGKSETKTYTEVIFKFQVDATFSNLWASPYSVYQQFLYDKITAPREQGLKGIRGFGAFTDQRILAIGNVFCQRSF